MQEYIIYLTLCLNYKFACSVKLNLVITSELTILQAGIVQIYVYMFYDLELKGDILIPDLWEKVTDTIHDMHVMNI